MKLELQDVSFKYGTTPILDNISLTLDKSELICIMGPNGVGKSTLMYCMNRLLKPTEGVVYIEDKSIEEIKRIELAKTIGFVPHKSSETFSASVLDTVLMGRVPYLKIGGISNEDVEIAETSLKRVNMEQFAMHPFDELSAGQHQRVMIARGLAQEPKILLLDEPTANLDLKYQMDVMQTLRDLVRERNITIITTCHDLNILSRYSDRVILMHDRKIYCNGHPTEVITSENIKTLYDVDSRIIEVEERPFVIPLSNESK